MHWVSVILCSSYFVKINSMGNMVIVIPPCVFFMALYKIWMIKLMVTVDSHCVSFGMLCLLAISNGV